MSIATVTAVPFKSLPEGEKRILIALREGSKNTPELMDYLKRGYHPINRALKSLEVKGWIEQDYELSGGKTKFYRLKQPPTDGIEILVNTGIDQESVSWNRFYESVARQLAGGRRPKIIEEAGDYYQALAMLGVNAAKEYVSAGSVSEHQMLELRSTIQRYADTLKDTYGVVIQILNNESIWHPDKLANGAIRKTDRHLTPAQIFGYARVMIDAFSEGDPDADEEEPDAFEGLNENESSINQEVENGSE